MKKKKVLREIALFLLACFIFPASFVFASEVGVLLDNKNVFFDTDPVIENGRVLVPFRGTLELMGYDVNWEDATKTIKTGRNGNTIEMKIGDVHATINGKPYLLDVPPKIVNDRTLIPLRMVAEGTGIEVSWEDVQKVVRLTTEEKKMGKLAQSVVLIETDKLQGSGVVFSADGVIVTNIHVIENAKHVSVSFEDGSRYKEEVKVIGYDYSRDIVFLKINKNGLQPVVLGDFSKVKVGDSAFTIGSPEGLKNLIGTGSITDVNQGIVEMTTPIQKGSSGGALFGIDGKLLGITHLHGEGKNYAISLPMLQKTKLDQNLTLEQWNNIEKPLMPPDYFDIQKQGNEISVFWEPLYNIDSYRIYISRKKDGTFEQVKNPNAGDLLWKWGFPYSFGLSIPEGKNYYIKVSAVRDGKESQKSQVVTLPNE